MTESLPDVPEITPEELVRAAEAGGPMQVLDVRAPERLAAGYIDVLPEDKFFNVAGSKLQTVGDPATIGITKSQPVAVVCGRGRSSRAATAFLLDRGFDARSLVGGMANWMATVIPRRVPAPTGFDGVLQFDRVGKGALGYAVWSDGEALVIDPPRQVDAYVTAVENVNCRIVAVADTHIHADYISGAPALAQSLGVPYYLHPADNSYPYDGRPGKLSIAPLEDSQRIKVGTAEVTVWHTPGHTEGSCTFLLGANAACTGDFLFIQSIGRPDLGGKVEAWAGQLWSSVIRARSDLSPDTSILPAHYSSDAERQTDRTVRASFSTLLASNEPVGIEDQTGFTTWIVDRKSEFPEAYRHIKAINVGLHDVTDDEANELEMGKNECAVG